MLKLRPSVTRGFLKTDWIESRRTFSNNSYYNKNYINYYNLEVINDDILQPKNKVPWHQHKNMEIFGYIVDGIATHTDSLKNNTSAKVNDIQFMFWWYRHMA